ncbi:MAG: energy transducer TonB, partial [Waterburya sp.]
MSYESKLARQSGKLLNPAKLCLFLSVGLHLLVLQFGLPSLNLDGDSSIREVSVIELSPEQQSRLPNVSPQLNTPNIPGFNNNLPPVDNSKPASPFAIPRSLIPGIGNPNNLPPVPIPPPPDFDLP